MATDEPQEMPARRIDAAEDKEISTAGQDRRFLPKPFAVRDCPPGMRIRGGRPIPKETGPKSTAKKGRESQEKQRGGPSNVPHKKKAGVVPTEVNNEEAHEEGGPLD